MNREDRRYAVLIDADNVSDKYVKIILDEISNYGVATYKRIYADWTKPKFARWKTMLLEHSITPIQQYSYTVGKNATDSAMIIDAMDILYSGKVEGFCLVTSDSDFTRLASRLREAGMDVIGMGETKTPKPFISSCNRFKYLDLIALDNELGDLADEAEERESRSSGKTVKKGAAAAPSGKTSAAEAEKPSGSKADASVPVKTMSARSMRKAIMAMVEENSDEDEWFPLGDLGNLILKRYPDFDVRNFGFKKFTPFIKSLGAFEFKEERVPGSNNKLTYIREKQEKQEKPAAPEKPAVPEKLPAPAAAAPAEPEKTPEKSGLPVAAPQTALVEKKDPVPGRRNWRRKNFGGKNED
ncbi:MAG: NYN domain-containing protein [Firmicutes bacterium]|nr:NYN domain-containing protein [Bacillota bacterium]